MVLDCAGCVDSKPGDAEMALHSFWAVNSFLHLLSSFCAGGCSGVFGVGHLVIRGFYMRIYYMRQVLVVFFLCGHGVYMVRIGWLTSCS